MNRRAASSCNLSWLTAVETGLIVSIRRATRLQPIHYNLSNDQAAEEGT